MEVYIRCAFLCIDLSWITVYGDDEQRSKLMAMSEIEETAVIGAIEIMLSPEYGSGWLSELLSDTALEDNEKNREELDNAITDVFHKSMQPLIKSLSPEKRASYERFLD